MLHPQAHQEGWFPGGNNLELYYQAWYPTTDMHAVIGIVHGLGSHSGWFAGLAEFLCAHGYGVYALDLRGHGRSPGQRGHILSWDDFRQDMHQFWHFMTTNHPTKPCFVLGHSLGAVIVLDYALRVSSNMAGIIAIAPALGSVGVAPWKLAIGQVLSQIWPEFSLETGIPQQAGSRDPRMTAAYAIDPLRHVQGTARLATEFIQTRQWIQTHLAKLNTPILIVQGSEDQVVFPRHSHQCFEQLQTMDKEYREYPGGYHDLHNDWCAEDMFQDVTNWLDQQVRHQPRICFLHHLTSTV
jgi:alpha-beta hydrolase superfamily lysophospholipase